MTERIWPDGVEPLIYVCKVGVHMNVPVSTLDYETQFVDKQTMKPKLTIENGQINLDVEKGGTITCIERYYDKETHEVVKESCHVCTFDALNMIQELGQLT